MRFKVSLFNYMHHSLPVSIENMILNIKIYFSRKKFLFLETNKFHIFFSLNYIHFPNIKKFRNFIIRFIYGCIGKNQIGRNGEN